MSHAGAAGHRIQIHLPIHKLFEFIKKNIVMTVALVAAAVTSVIIPPDAAYVGYFDLKTLTCLFCVLAVVCALKNIRFFYILAERIIKLCGNARISVLTLVYITFIGTSGERSTVSISSEVPAVMLTVCATGDDRVRLVSTPFSHAISIFTLPFAVIPLTEPHSRLFGRAGRSLIFPFSYCISIFTMAHTAPKLPSIWKGGHASRRLG